MTRTIGKYQLVRKLAMGGMAEVYLAKAAGPRGFEKTLVVKCILPHLAQEPSFVEMFHSEAMLAARLTHPHIVQIFDFGEVDGSYFLAMEYIDGPSLRTLIKRASARRIPLPPAVCARLVSQACEGLAFAHDFVDAETGQALGLVHRDVSPDNLLLSLQGTVKVVDFGIAKVAGQGHQTRSGVVKGKLAYMPPEQLRGRSVDRRVDVYALGVVLYELLTSHKPHTAENEAALMHAILFDAPVPAEHHRPDLPEPLRRILARATAKERDQRYPDCHALQEDLEDFILSEGRPVTAQQVAQLIQRATSGMGLPAQRPTPTPTRTAPTLPAATQKETAPEAPRPEDVPTREALPALVPATPAWALEPTRLQGRGATPARPSRGTRRALVGAVMLLAGTGLVWGARGRRMDPPVKPEAPSVPRTASVAPPPAVVPASLEPEAPPKESPEEPRVASEEPLVVRPRSARPSKPRRSVTAAAVAIGQVDVRSQPYARVSVDGREVGTTPLDGPLELAVGDHTVTFFSPTLSRTEVRQVDVKAGKTSLVNVSFPR